MDNCLNQVKSIFKKLLTCIKLPSVFKTFVLSIFEWPLKTGLTVCKERKAQTKNRSLTPLIHQHGRLRRLLPICNKYSKTCLKRPLKIRQDKDGSLMKVESIAE